MDYPICAKKLEADNRFPLSFYFRIAANMINQANVYREEKNITDLFITLDRYSSLVSETIPQHQSYSMYSGKEKFRHRKMLPRIFKELEVLKSLFRKKVDEINRQHLGEPKSTGDITLLTSQGQNQRDHTFSYSNDRKVDYSSTFGLLENRGQSQSLNTNHLSLAKSGSVRSSLSWENIGLASVIKVDASAGCSPSESPCSTTSAAGDCRINIHVVTQSSPSPVLSCFQIDPHKGNDFTCVSHIPVINPRDGHPRSSRDDISGSKAIQDVHISVRLMEDFLDLARVNTNKNVETCGVLGASLKNRTFYVTTLIVPKQESTLNSHASLRHGNYMHQQIMTIHKVLVKIMRSMVFSDYTEWQCQALNEEEIYAIQDEQSLFPLGWIHTHPSQTCFMSSIDLHTHYSYQIMLPEAVAIVMAPTDASRSYGIFRLSVPGGAAVLRKCQQKGFHSHEEPADGSPIYEDCSHVYINPNLRFEIIDLR